MSVSIRAQVTPKVLTWARNSSGFSREEVAEKLNQTSATPDAIKAWEKGHAQPTYTQLEKLANIYKRPIAIFFFPSPPEETALNEKLRSVPDVFTQSLPPRIRYLVRKALVKQMDLYDLHGENAPADIKILRNQIENIPVNNVIALATAMREIINISLEKQFSWRTFGSALKQWRDKLENIGIWVFKDAFQDENYCGFCLYDENFPVIYINNSMPEQRQIFTLFHEMGHLLIAKGGIDFRKNIEHEFQGTYREEEVFCNAFAGSFLVPDDDFPISTAPDDQEILKYARKYKVSREVILRKCFDRGLVTQELYNNKVVEWRESWESRRQSQEGQEKQKDTGNYYATQRSYLGDKYLTLLFKQYYQNRIDQYKLADYLGIKVGSIESLEGYVLGGKG